MRSKMQKKGVQEPKLREAKRARKRVMGAFQGRRTSRFAGIYIYMCIYLFLHPCRRGGGHDPHHFICQFLQDTGYLGSRYVYVYILYMYIITITIIPHIRITKTMTQRELVDYNPFNFFLVGVIGVMFQIPLERKPQTLGLFFLRRIFTVGSNQSTVGEITAAKPQKQRLLYVLHQYANMSYNVSYILTKNKQQQR